MIRTICFVPIGYSEKKMSKNEQPNHVDTFTWVIVTCQILFYPVLCILRLLFLRSHVKFDQSFFAKYDKQKNHLIYANHESKLDAFLICSAFPFGTFFNLLPIRFFVKNSYFENVLFTYPLTLLGGFPAQKSATPYGLIKAQNSLQKGQSVFIFPQGGITRDKTAKRGISVLSTFEKIQLIPVFISWKNYFSCHITIGVPFTPSKQLPPETLMDYVYKLETKL